MLIITDDVAIDVLRAISRDEVDATQLANRYLGGLIASNTFKAVTPLRPLVMNVGCGAISVKRHEEDNYACKYFYKAEELTDWARNGCARVFSLDARSEDNVRWFLKNRSTFTVQRTNLTVPVCSEELEQQLMAKSLGTDITITGDSPAVPRLTMNLKHAAFERCYKLRFVNKRTQLTVTAKQLRHWLHLPTIRDSMGRIREREIYLNTRHIVGNDDDITELLMRLRKTWLVDGRNDMAYCLILYVTDEHLDLLDSTVLFPEVVDTDCCEGGYFDMSAGAGLSDYIVVERSVRM
ncbi:hypothetical protein AAVH_08113 [Aphelenchoides avenae]|nr:hypothetical protein AAVH_08113 [Aphelenchus avenae]